MMYEISPNLFAYSNRQHLRYATLDWASEGGMRLHADSHDDTIRLQRTLGDINGKLRFKIPDTRHFHRGFDRHTHAFRRNSIRCQNFRLSGGRCPSMAAHGRNDEGFGARANQFIDKRLGYLLDIGNSPASDPDCDPFSLEIGQVRRQLRSNFFRNIANPFFLEVLPHLYEPWQRNCGKPC